MNLEACGLTLDTTSGRLYHGESSVRLNVSEAQVAQVLMLSVGCYLDREKILRLGGFVQDASARLVDALVENLRKKLDVDRCEPYSFISQKPGFGYSLFGNWVPPPTGIYLEAGDVRLFPHSKRVLVGAREITLEWDEYKLLLLLLKHKGHSPLVAELAENKIYGGRWILLH